MAAIVLALVAVGSTAAGCGRTVPGSPAAVGEGGGNEGVVNMDFDKLLRECEVLTEGQMAEAVGGDASFRGSFVGAVCMWDVQGAPGGNAKLTLNWFEHGSLNVERQTYQKLGYESSITTIQGASAVQIRRPGDPDSCGVSAKAADAGIVGWWINYRAGSAHPDPCPVAAKLVELTLNRAR
ncbi:DUF3558 domain-containing protein [Nocardia asteroides]|uniref:Lipoprotein LprC n=1 Tax=Nocardia asteroides NBRC 15531 TaxID=1110697 RepID=U5E8W9_NOCAS|nr:DUF3558 domain-containing protein [Nocardia asteroides]UGT49227.1 DUF3558 domain-containing protein [Nocardia asteroides]GAD83805.1 hypothetical protein NCAST_20_03740 [Nocardia asteroides NBRC 15531]SFL84185.1 Protein of unknown function [Nocardia asteroides]VEG38463.1 Protein of uncharacterised function (DUF3558) [Nocardia asteroides]